MPNNTRAVYTASMSVAVEPAMKSEVEDAARKRGIKPAVVIRWAIELWMAEHENAEAR